MIEPTPAEVIAIRADARRRFGSDRALVVRLTEPIDACLVLAPFDLAYYKGHVDARTASLLAAQAGAVVDRLLWCSPQSDSDVTIDTLTATAEDPDPIHRVGIDRLELLRAAWPAVDSEVETEMGEQAGHSKGADLARAVRLTAGNPPPGLSAAEAAKLLDGTPTRGAGALWAVSHPITGLSIVLKAPQPAAWLAARAAFAEAMGKRSGVVDSTLVLARQLVVWSPEPFDTYIDRMPGYAEALWRPMLDMGGAASVATSTFL